MSGSKSSGDGWIKVLGVLFALFIVLNVISFIWMPFLPWMEQRQAGEEVVKDQMDADKAINDYREFRQMYHDIEAQRDQIENVYAEEKSFHETYGDDPNEWSREGENRHSRIHTRITGNKQILEDMIAEYNAKSDDVTSEIFKCNLPYQVGDRFAIAGPPGSDAPDEPVDTGPDGEPVDGEPAAAEQCDGLPDKVDT